MVAHRPSYDEFWFVLRFRAVRMEGVLDFLQLPLAFVVISVRVTMDADCLRPECESDLPLRCRFYGFLHLLEACEAHVYHDGLRLL